MAVAALEKKVALLEQRLVLMERFVEMRFSETFHDFSIRNLSSSSSDNQVSADKVPERLTTRSSNLGKRKVPSTSAAADGGEEDTPIASSSSSTGMRELRIRVIRIKDQNQAEGGGGDDHQEENLEETQEETQTESQPHLVKISREDEDDEVDFEEGIGGDLENEDYFMYSSGEVDDAGGGGDEDDLDLSAEDVDAVDSDDKDWSESSPPKKKRRSRTRRPSSSQGIPPGGIILVNGKAPPLECPKCHSHWKTEANYNKHLVNCTNERKFKCGFENCEKGFFTKKSLRNHEKLHEPEKWEKMCRVGGGCTVKMVHLGHLLEHERICIRRVLGKGGRVEEGVLEDVKRRSQNFEVTLGKKVKVTPKKKKRGEGVTELKRCRYCEEEVDRREYLRHLDKHRNWKCGICGNGGDGGGDEEEGGKGGFMEKKSLVRHLIRTHGLSRKKADEKVEGEEEEMEEGIGGGDEEEIFEADEVDEEGEEVDVLSSF